MLRLRDMIFETAAETPGVGAIEECLKWDQPAYLTSQSKSGTTVRLGYEPDDNGACMVYVHCQTNLVTTYRRRYGDLFEFEGNRAIKLPLAGTWPKSELKECLQLALTYHARKSEKQSASTSSKRLK